MADNIQTVISQSESVLMAGFESSFRASHFMILLVVFGASTLPTWGKHVTQHGQARCPKWADFVTSLCPKVYHESVIRWCVCFMTDCYYHWYCHYVVAVCFWTAAGTRIKKMKADSPDFTRIGLFTDSFFDDIELMILGFWFWFSRICKCWGTFFFLSLCFLDKNQDKHTSCENIKNTRSAKT